LHSALNQNLDAEISLLLSPGEKLTDIKVTLAPPDKFDENGVPWTYFLSKIKFEPVAFNGSAVIKISSKEALKEPFLDFLLEVSWPKGSLYREFTVLVDPPEVYQQAAIPVASTRPDEYEPEREYIPERRSTRSVRRAVASGSIGANGYGPTSRNDTLWRIAEQVSKDPDVSIEQMLIALYEENPHAFYKANINTLLAGKTLRIPSKDVVLKLSRKQASSEFNRQIQAWKNHQLEDVSVATGQDELADNQLKLIAPAQEPVPEKAIVTSGQGQVSADNEPSATTGPGQASAVSDEAKKTGSSPATADSTIQNKIAALEKQLAVMQELMALKDQQLAALQNQSQAKPMVQVPAGQTEPTDAVIAKPEVTAPADAVVAKPEVTVPAGAVVTKPEVTAPTDVVVSKPAQPKPVPPRSVSKPAARPVDHAKTETGSSVDWYYLGIGGAGAGLLAVLGWLWWRQRQFEKMEESAGPFVSAGFTKAIKPVDVFSESAEDSYGLDLAGGENIFASDFAAGDFDVIDMDQGEIDPISEADVYLAYGRYQQAEDLMRDAIADQPERDECKLKLLEIFYANGNKRAFETYVGELVSAGKKDDVMFWAKVTEMGSEICADSPLFASEMQKISLNKNANHDENRPVPVKTGDAKADELIDDMDFDLASFEELFDSNTARDMFGEKNDLFDIDTAAFEAKQQAQAVERHDEPKQNNESIDFDLSLFEVDTQAADKVEKTAPVAEPKNEFESFDFNLDDAEAEGIAEPDLNMAAVPAADENFEVVDFSSAGLEKKSDQGLFDGLKTEDTLEFDESYHAVDFSTDKTAGFDEPELGKNIQDSFDDFDFNIPVESNASGQKSFGVADLAEMDEMETKLDLAIAYVDMGDAEAAREIALEVLKKGTAEQQMVAQALLDGL